MTGSAPLRENQDDFWSETPCGSIGSFVENRDFLFRMEPWVQTFLSPMTKSRADVVEIGTGQGILSQYLCTQLPAGSRYVGIDYSRQSVALAKENSRLWGNDTSVAGAVLAEHEVGDAENLRFSDASFDVALSSGALHHTADTEKAIAEVYRVLKPGGRAYVTMYRTAAPKVLIAKTLRNIQSSLDQILGTKQCIYRMILGRHAPFLFGTMLLECFGVPYLKSYSRSQIVDLFGDFEVETLTPVGFNLPYFLRVGQVRIPYIYGYMWGVVARKR